MLSSWSDSGDRVSKLARVYPRDMDDWTKRYIRLTAIAESRV